MEWKRMTDLIVDANIVLNVWWREVDPRGGEPPWESSSKILSAAREGLIRCHICLVNVFELVHHVRVRASRSGKDPEAAIQLALKNIVDFNIKQIVPEPFTLSKSLNLIVQYFIDPFDAVLVATAVDGGMDCIISRDRKLKKKAAALIPVLTPEEFLSKNP